MKRVSILAMLVLILAVGALPAAAITGGELDGEGHPNVGLMIADIDGEPALALFGHADRAAGVSHGGPLRRGWGHRGPRLVRQRPGRGPRLSLWRRGRA